MCVICCLFQDISDNHLSVPFAQKFIEVLVNNSTLTHITLAGW